MVDGAEELDLSLDVIKSSNLGFVDGLDGILLASRSVEALTDASIVSSAKDGWEDVVIAKDVAVSICYYGVAAALDIGGIIGSSI